MSADVHAAVEGVGHFDDGVLPHAEHEQIGLGIHQDRAADPVVPVVIMREPAQAGLDAADHDRHMREQPLEDLRVDDGRPDPAFFP